MEFSSTSVFELTFSTTSPPNIYVFDLEAYLKQYCEDYISAGPYLDSHLVFSSIFNVLSVILSFYLIYQLLQTTFNKKSAKDVKLPIILQILAVSVTILFLGSGVGSLFMIHFLDTCDWESFAISKLLGYDGYMLAILLLLLLFIVRLQGIVKKTSLPVLTHEMILMYIGLCVLCILEGFSLYYFIELEGFVNEDVYYTRLGISMVMFAYVLYIFVRKLYVVLEKFQLTNKDDLLVVLQETFKLSVLVSICIVSIVTVMLFTHFDVYVGGDMDKYYVSITTISFDSLINILCVVLMLPYGDGLYKVLCKPCYNVVSQGLGRISKNQDVMRATSASASQDSSKFDTDLNPQQTQV